MKDQRLLNIFQDAKKTLCENDYYIHVPKKIIHITNREDQIPHLMGLQYVGRPGQFVGDYGAYAVKKGKMIFPSLEKLIEKYYRDKKKQKKILELIHLKLNNLDMLPCMFNSYSKLYLYEKNQNLDTEFSSDYLLVHQTDKKILHLGLVTISGKRKELCRCNSFMTTYKKDRDADVFYRDLKKTYEIRKIVREDKVLHRRRVVYISEETELREQKGIEKMLLKAGVEATTELVARIKQLNKEFGKFHTFDEINGLFH